MSAQKLGKGEKMSAKRREDFVKMAAQRREDFLNMQLIVAYLCKILRGLLRSLPKLLAQDLQDLPMVKIQ